MKIFTLLQNLLKMITGQTGRNLPFISEKRKAQSVKPNMQSSTLNAQRVTPDPVLHSNKSVQRVNASVQNPVAPLNDASVSFEYKILPVQKKITSVQNIKPVFMQNFFAIVKKIFSLSDHPTTLLENLNEGYHPGCHYGTAGRENISLTNQLHDVANPAASFALIPIAITPTAMNQLEKKPVKTITGRSGLVGILMLMSSLFFITNLSAQIVTQTVPGNYTFTVPANVFSITIQAWGAGGAGGSGSGANNSTRGGGGGAFATTVITSLTPGTIFNYTVGAGGVPNATQATPPTTAGATFFGNTTAGAQAGSQVVAAAGAFGTGTAGTGTGGAGGLASACIPTTGAFSGGNGGQGTNNNNGGGGGGSAGGGGNGGNGGTSVTGGTAGTAGSFSAGAVGGAGGAALAAGVNGIVPGSGGGGKGVLGSLSGSGAAGEIIITYCVAPNPPTVVSPVSYCIGSTASPLSATGSNLLWYTLPSGGTGSSTAPTPSTSTVGTTHYYVSQTVASCESQRAQIDVVVNPTPTTTVNGSSNITCNGANDGTITIAASGGTPDYFFSVDNGNTYTPITHTSPYIFPGLSPNTPYTIRVKDTKGCQSQTF